MTNKPAKKPDLQVIESEPTGETIDAKYIKFPFTRTDSHIMFQPPEDEKKKDKENGPIALCGWVSIEGKCSNDDGKKYHLKLQYVDINGVTRTAMISLGDMMKNSFPHFVELHNAGLWINTSQQAKLALNRYFSEMCKRRFPKILLVPQPGWSGGVYVSRDRTFGHFLSGEFDSVELAPTYASAQRLSEEGTLEEWRATVAKLCAGNPLLVFAICVSLAGVILRPTRQEGGGFHFYGSSSTGKSTALKIANGLWTSVADLLSWSGTTNGINANAAACNDRTLILDEIGAGGANQDLTQVIYTASNGSQKQRANRDGNKSDVGQAASWLSMILSSGEKTVRGILAQRGMEVPPGCEIRLVDIRVDNMFMNLHGYESADAFGKALSEAYEKFYGTVGPAFIEMIVANLKDIDAQDIFNIEKTLIASSERAFNAQDHRVARRIATACLAGELATAAGITGWKPNEPRTAAQFVWDQYVEGLPTLGSREEQQVFDIVRYFLAVSDHELFGSIHVEPDKTRPVKIVGWKGELYGEELFCMRTEVFKEKVCKPRIEDSFARNVLKKYGYLVCDGGKTERTTKKEKIHQQKADWVMIKRSILEGEK